MRNGIHLLLLGYLALAVAVAGTPGKAAVGERALVRDDEDGTRAAVCRMRWR
jgi:hypothetical protein